MPRERAHRGDFMDRATRSRVMSRIRGKDTGPERIIAELLAVAGLDAEQQVRDLPGRPDFVLRDARVAIFVDGDFWHGWRFSTWRHKLSEKWEAKIEANRRRDVRNHARLKRAGWTVVRVWQHQIESNLDTVRLRLSALRTFAQS
jgi:DNA mismatch endonuclease, patch repair protein